MVLDRKQRDILFNDIGFEDRVTYEHKGDGNIGFRQKDIKT